MDLRTFSAIARPVDLRYATNRAIALAASIVLVGEAVRHLIAGAGWAQSGKLGVGLGLVVFLAWALGRELDPDEDRSAFVGAGFALIGALVWGLPSLSALFWVLLMVRLVNRTTGLRATVLDSLGLLGLGAWLSFQVFWTFGAITTIAFLLDGAMLRAHRMQIVFGTVSAILAAVSALAGGGEWLATGSWVESVALSIVLLVAFLPGFLAAGELHSVGDDTQTTLASERVRAGQTVALLAGVNSAIWGGFVGFVLLLPLWCAFLGVFAYRLFVRPSR